MRPTETQKEYFSKCFGRAVLLAIIPICFVGCKEAPMADNELYSDMEIVFGANGLDMQVVSRATEVTSLETFNVLACTGAEGSQVNYWGQPVAVTKVGEEYRTGKYWALANPGLTSFYASNESLSFSASGPAVTISDCGTDVVCAHLSSPAYGTKNMLSFGHILARVRTVTINTQSGYALSSVSAVLEGGITGGTYNLRTQTWTSTDGGSNKAMSAFSGDTSSQASINDLWLLPGTYTMSVSYTLTKGDYSVNLTKSGSITILAGMNNTITATAVGANAGEIVFGVSIDPWNDNAVGLALN